MTKRLLFLAFCLTSLVITQLPGFCGLAPHEVVVVYNSDARWPESKAVADYYCAICDIPVENKFGLSFPIYEDDPYASQPKQKTDPWEFSRYIAEPLKAFLQSRFGSDPNDPASDPIKAIVLCYGLPSKIWTQGRFSSVDSPLSLLFNNAPWGMDPIGGMKVSPGWQVDNPYYEWAYDPDARTKPADFGEFRKSAGNDVHEDAPAFKVVRLLSDSLALAGTRKGGVFRGERTGDVWDWTAASDPQKMFMCYDVSDICVVGASGLAWLCNEEGAVLRTLGGGQTWETQRYKEDTWTSAGFAMRDKLVCVSSYSDSSAWIVGAQMNSNNLVYGIPFVERFNGTIYWSRVSNFPSGFSEPSAVAVADGANPQDRGDDHVWLAGKGGIIFSPDNGTSWSWCYQGSDVGKIRVLKQQGGSYIGWAVAAGAGCATMLYTTTPDGLTWTALASPTLPSGAKNTADICVVDPSHVTIAYGSQELLVYNGSAWAVESSGASGKVSAAWNGSRIIAGTSSPTVNWGRGTPGALTWDSSYTIPAMHWKMRYIVCRLDGYGYPLEPTTEDPNGPKIPRDVKGMIDRSVAATPGGTFLIDDHPTYPSGSPSGVYSADFVSVLQGMSGIDVDYDPSSQYQMHNTSVMGYSSHGDYDYFSHEYTTWFRPFNTWRPGAIGVFRGSSTDGRSLRSPAFLGRNPSSTKLSKTGGQLKV